MKAIINMLLFSLATILMSNVYADDIIGKYECTGSDPTGAHKYKANLTVEKNADVFKFTWVNANGSVNSIGTGITNKSVNGVVSVVFWDVNKPELIGVGEYQVASDGSLQGAWAGRSETATNTENCIKK